MPFFFSMLTIGLQKRKLPITPLHIRGNINVIRCLMGLVLKIENILDVKNKSGMLVIGLSLFKIHL